MRLLGLILIVIVKNSFAINNLDKYYPIIYEDPELNPHRSTYFGYSVLIYSKNDYTWIQIGAPRANNSKITKIEEPGMVYRCGLIDYCIPYHLDSEDNRNSKDNDGIDYFEKKDRGWLGGTMALHYEADLLVACAPRWKEQSVSFWKIQGSCFTTRADDKNPNPLVYRLIPLLGTKDSIKLDSFKIPDEMFGQAGISARFNKIVENNTVELMLGVPGKMSWKGSVVMMKDVNFNETTSRRRESVKISGKFDEHHMIQVINTQYLKYGDYFGYSVESGCFFKPNEYVYVAGAPRSDSNNGKVLIYNYDKEYSIKLIQSLNFDQFGGYFGAVLAVGDLNNDGLDDLLVSAPTLNVPTVFIYFGSIKGSLTLPNGTYESLENLQEPSSFGLNSRFGTALTIADLDRDGHNDILVGAPHAFDNKGAVAIWAGGAKGPKGDGTPMTVLHPSDIYPYLRGFGISIAPPFDLDSNGYPEVAIGSYLSGHVVILRGRPTASLKIENSLVKIPRDVTYFTLPLCVNYTVFSNVTTPIRIRWFISIDSSYRRVFFNDTNPSESKTIEMELKDNVKHCENFTIHLKKVINDYVKPIVLVSNATIIDYMNTTQLLSVTKDKIEGVDGFNKWYPIPSVSEEEFTLTFTTGCAGKNICKSDLKVEISAENGTNTFILGSADVLNLKITVNNVGEHAYLTQIQFYLPNPASLARLTSECHTLANDDSDEESAIICNVENPLKKGESKSLYIEVNMQDISKVKRDGEIITFAVKGITQSVEIDPADNEAKMSIALVEEASIRIAGKSQQDSYQYVKLDKGEVIEKVHFQHLFEVQKFGASPIDEVLISVKVPYSHVTKKGEFQFIGISPPQGKYQNRQSFSCQKTDFVYESSNEVLELSDFSSVESNNSQRVVSKRSIEYDTQITKAEMKAKNLSANRTVLVTCEENNIKCHEIICIVGPFRRRQTVARLFLTMTLDISSIKESLMGIKDILLIKSDGRATIIRKEMTLSADSDFHIFSTFVSSTPERKVPLWLIIVSVLLGLLLLTILITGLVKAGFFERKKKKELLLLRKETQKRISRREVIPEKELVDEEVNLNIEDIR